MVMLSSEECRRLLAGHQSGRLAVVMDDQLVILPVKWALDVDAIGVRTDPGQKFDGAVLAKGRVRGGRHRRRSREGWSVVVQGPGDDAAATTLPRRARETPLTPWAPGATAQWIKIFSEAITGWRLTCYGM